MEKWIVQIGRKLYNIEAEDSLEACTQTIEHIFQNNLKCEIGSLIACKDCNNKEYRYVSDLVLANAGRYREAAMIQQEIEKQLKNKKKT